MDHELHVFWHTDVLLHDTGRGVFEGRPSDLLAIQEKHPEGPNRIVNMLSILKRGPLAKSITWRHGRHCSEKELELVHSADYIKKIKAFEKSGNRRFTETTVFSPGSYQACLAAVGTTLEAVYFAIKSPGSISYALVRPPGHHAAPDQMDGYCIFNNAGIAAEFALQNGASRVAVIDWDVHHGNGTQEAFYDRSDVLTISIHMDHGPWGSSHPQTGKAEELGKGPGHGFNMNLPLPMGTGDSGYCQVMDQLVTPKIRSFRPDLLIIACGQDASQFDPNGRQLVTMEGFRYLGRKAREITDQYADGKLLVVQEGGYAVSYAALCLNATLEGMLDTDVHLNDPLAYLPENEEASITVIENLKNFFSL